MLTKGKSSISKFCSRGRSLRALQERDQNKHEIKLLGSGRVNKGRLVSCHVGLLGGLFDYEVLKELRVCYVSTCKTCKLSAAFFHHCSQKYNFLVD